MLTDILVSFILYYIFFILEDTPQAAIVAPEPMITEDSDSTDDWEPESEGETIILSTQVIEQVEQNQNVLQNLIDAEEQNWCITPQGSFRHSFPTLGKGRKKARRYWRVRNPLPN